MFYSNQKLIRKKDSLNMKNWNIWMIQNRNSSGNMVSFSSRPNFKPVHFPVLQAKATPRWRHPNPIFSSANPISFSLNLCHFAENPFPSSFPEGLDTVGVQKFQPCRCETFPSAVYPIQQEHAYAHWRFLPPPTELRILLQKVAVEVSLQLQNKCETPGIKSFELF